MKTIRSVFSHSLEIKKSSFLSFLSPIDEFETLLKTLKASHPKARHIVTATRILQNSQILEYSNDDNEPRGTSGKPTLNVLQKQDLINVGIATVRYFGGIKLGAGGLVRAYSKSATGVVEAANLIDFLHHTNLEFSLKLKDLARFEYLCLEFNAKIKAKNFTNETCKLSLEIEDTKQDKFKQALQKSAFFGLV